MDWWHLSFTKPASRRRIEFDVMNFASGQIAVASGAGDSVLVHVFKTIQLLHTSEIEACGQSQEGGIP